jgi:hypothetical protein
VPLLEEAFQKLQNRGYELDADELIHRLERQLAGETEPIWLTRNRRRRGWLAAVAAAAAVALLIGGVAVVTALLGNGSQPVINQPTPTLPTVEKTPPTVTPTTVTTVPTTTTTVTEPVATPPIEGCEEWYTEFLSERGRECDLVQGEQVPTVFGPLLDGGWFDLTDLKGRPAVVFTWTIYNGPEPTMRRLTEFQVLYDKWSDQIGFVSISEDTADVAQQAVAQGGFTFPVVTCISEPTGRGTTVLCGPNQEEFLWVWWGNQDFPSWTVLDSDGRFVDIRLGYETTLEEIDSLLASIIGS